MIQTYKPSATYEEALDRAARLWGIEPGYGDTWGRQHVTTPEVERAILGAMGVDATSRETLDDAVERRTFREWDRVVPHIFVAGRKAWPDGFPIHVRAGAEGTATIEIRWENGTRETKKLPLSALAESGRVEVCTKSYVRKQVPIPETAPLGYHDVQVTVRPRKGPAHEASMRLILCPDRTYSAPAISNGGRVAGLAIALYGLRSSRNWGCGDFTDVEAFTDWASAETRTSFIGLNPLHAIANRQPYNISPYLPTSTFFKNAIYLDLDRIDDFRNSRRAMCWAACPETQREIEALRGAGLIEYERVWALKLRGLKLAFAHFLREYRKDSERARQFRAYIEEEGEALDRFATWCALDDWIHRSRPDIWVWPDWPEEFREPDSLATRSFAAKYWRLVLFYKYAQWQTDLQLEHAQQHARAKGLAIGLFHDLALAVDRVGADLWAYRDYYVNGCRVGSPPDTFSPKGQDWSFPPPDSDHHRETGYRLFAESIRQNCRHGGALRMDHVMRFFRLYWIPEGFDPTQGAYVRDRYDELLHIVALESVRNEVIVVGEDLGTVTTEIRRALDGFGISGYKVPYFEKYEGGEFRPPQEYAAQALVASSTHDLPTLAGFWTARDIEARRAAGLLPDERAYREQLEDRRRDKQRLLDALFAQGLLPDWVPRSAGHIPELTGELHNAITGWLAIAPSRLLALNQEDLLKNLDQQNLPATTDEYPNWRHRMRLTVEELQAGTARDFTTMFRNWLARTGRLNPA